MSNDELTFLSSGMSSEIAKKAVEKGYSLEKLSKLSQKRLDQVFGYLKDGSIEGTSVSEAVNRKPIEASTVQKLLSEADWKCCVCWSFSEESPVIIHHIGHYSDTKDNSYENLVVLCPNHHSLAHSTWSISRHPLPPELLKKRKAEWAQAIAEYKKGVRPAPEKESSKQDLFNQSDRETLNRLRMFIDRPAMHQPFDMEGNMADFLTAITDIIRALNTGILKTREGDEICRTKPRTMLSNPKWMEKLDLITCRFVDMRTRFEIAIRNNEITVQPSGFYYFSSRELPVEIDSMRETIILLFNELLQEAGLLPLNGVKYNPRHPRFW